MARARIEVNLEELDQVLEEARQAPLSQDDYQKLKTALHALAEWARSRSTEKTKAVLGETEDRSKADADTSGLSGAPAAAVENGQKTALPNTKIAEGFGPPLSPA